MRLIIYTIKESKKLFPTSKTNQESIKIYSHNEILLAMSDDDGIESADPSYDMSFFFQIVSF